MPKTIQRTEVLRLLDEEDAQLVDALPRKEYEDEHVPGAVSIPLTELDEKTTAVLDRERPVIAYCYDDQCDLSPRAARRLEALGFHKVYDYVCGKMDWFAAGLPREGKKASTPRIEDAVRRDIPTCAPSDPIDEISRAVREAAWDACAVLNEEGVVLGLVGAQRLVSGDGVTAGEVMKLGPSTYRPHVSLEEIVDRFSRKNIKRALVTSSDGRLIGMLFREDAERMLAADRREAHAS